MAVSSSTHTAHPATRSPAGRAPSLVTTGLMVVALFGSGCQLTPSPLLGPSEIENLSAELAQLETLVSATRDDLATLTSAQSEQMDSVSKRLRTIDGGVKQLPGVVQTACKTEISLPTTCDEIAIQTILIDDDKMVVGESEHLWITPPGIGLSARIDTGTNANSIHASDITSFERDGDNWVRFTLTSGYAKGDTKQANTQVVVERKIVRQLRTSKRPVVKLRVQLGNVLDSFDFILTDRTSSEHPVELGRSFLQDVALVDVGKQFVQPRFTKSKEQDESTADGQ